MARYVLIEFEDNEAAEGFYETILSGQDTSGAKMRVAGVYMKPTQYCECSNPSEKSVRGSKWGLWVHKDCGKPKKGMWQSPRNLLVDGEKPAKRNMMFQVVEPRQEIAVNAGTVSTSPQGQ